MNILTVSAASAALGVSTGSIMKFIRESGMPTTPPPEGFHKGNIVCIDLDEVQAWLEDIPVYISKRVQNRMRISLKMDLLVNIAF